MSVLLIARVDGVPGPKGSVNAFCLRCAQRKLPQKVVIKEQSEVGVLFRKVVARELRHHPIEMQTGPVKTTATFYIHRQRVVRAGVELDRWVPSNEPIVPIHHGSGDIEKHVRTVHDAMQDAGVFVEDCQVSDLNVCKRWATAAHPPGLAIVVSEITEEDL